MYIGPQGIVHGTTLTLLNAARIHLNLPPDRDLSGITFVTSGLGGMSGAQAKAAVIAGASCIVAEMNPHAAVKRHEQGWLSEISYDVDEAIDMMVSNSKIGNAISIGYVGNVADLWKRLVERNIKVDLGSDQTSLHNPWQGGYFPSGYTYSEAADLMSKDSELFCQKVRQTLLSHMDSIKTMAERGMYFWDYGNAFLLEASRAGSDIVDEMATLSFLVMLKI
tara:strand:- start:257 stop:922 length:666 start_codon:yes stop_codon:yes gene_type:complete